MASTVTDHAVAEITKRQSLRTSQSAETELEAEKLNKVIQPA